MKEILSIAAIFVIVCMHADFIFEKLSKKHLPGVSIAILNDGEIVYSRVSVSETKWN